MSFKKISDVEEVESASSSLNGLVEDNGEMKRLPWDFVMQAQTGVICISFRYEDLEDEYFQYLPDDEFYALAAAIKNGTNMVCTLTGVICDDVTYDMHFTSADAVVCEGKDSEAVAGGVWDYISMYNSWWEWYLCIRPEWERDRDD